MKTTLFVAMTGLGTLAAGCGPKQPVLVEPTKTAQCPETLTEDAQCATEGQECRGTDPVPKGCSAPMMECKDGKWVPGPMPTCNPPPLPQRPGK